MPLRVTVAVRFEAVSSIVVLSDIDSTGALSSSVIVMTPVATEIEAFTGLLNPMVKVSSGSSMLSCIIVTDTVCDVTPGLNVKVPDAEL